MAGGRPRPPPGFSGADRPASRTLRHAAFHGWNAPRPHQATRWRARAAGGRPRAASAVYAHARRRLPRSSPHVLIATACRAAPRRPVSPRAHRPRRAARCSCCSSRSSSHRCSRGPATGRPPPAAARRMQATARPPRAPASRPRSVRRRTSARAWTPTRAGAPRAPSAPPSTRAEPTPRAPDAVTAPASVISAARSCCRAPTSPPERRHATARTARSRRAPGRSAGARLPRPEPTPAQRAARAARRRAQLRAHRSPSERVWGAAPRVRRNPRTQDGPQ